MRSHQRYTNYDIIQRLIAREFTNGHHAECIRDYIVLEDGFDTLMAALVNGYIAEKSAEELAEEARLAALGLVTRRYESARCEASYGFKYAEGVASGIRHTLNDLGITIEGVNA